MGNFTYPHNEQIKYSTPPLASPDAQMAKSSQLSTLICNAALQRKADMAIGICMRMH
jgi:hypothetical protein